MSGLSKEIIIRTIGTGGALAVVIILANNIYQSYLKRIKNSIPIKWTEIGKVSDLFIYPLKSGRSLRLEEGVCEKTGLVLIQDNKRPLKDREILVFTDSGKGERKFRNARNYPKLLLINVTVLNDSEIILETTDPSVSPLIINTERKNLELNDCTFWYGEYQRFFDCGNEAAKWISRYCSGEDSGLRIGLSSDFKRSIDVDPGKTIAKAYGKLTNDDFGLFADVSSYMLINQASLDDLNEKLPNVVSSLNFRPNIVVKGPEAFAEDNWDWVKIGDEVIFRCVKPCTRCTIVNLDPENGIPDYAVLKKLKEYRQNTNEDIRKIEGDSPVMGVYAGIRNPGSIKLGDKVYVG